MFSVIPGFRLSLGITLTYLGFIVLLPIAALLLHASDVGLARYFAIITSPRTLAAFQITIGAAAIATLFNAIYGLMLAWVLVRYDFPGRRLLDTLVDVPFALPTAVAGLALTALFAKNGWFGAPLAQYGIEVAYAPAGIVCAMAFTSIPFVVRTVQPVLEDLEADLEEAATTLGASQLRVFLTVIMPAIFPPSLPGPRSPSPGRWGSSARWCSSPATSRSARRSWHCSPSSGWRNMIMPPPRPSRRPCWVSPS